jgi:hypothetical protein
MDYRRPSSEAVAELAKALRGNANDECALRTSRDTSFVDTAEEITDDEVISAIKSIPSHY